jgi:ankyrin repeat protein
MKHVQDPSRRALFAAAMLPGLERLLEPLGKLGSRGSWDDWFRAVRSDDVNRCRSLIARGFDVNTLEADRFDTGLIIAVRERSAKVFKLLLDTPGIDVDARSRNGDTALMVAAFLPDAVAVQALLEHGAEVNRPGWAPLHYAASSGSILVIRVLLDHHAFIDAESPNKTTPLMMAARAGRRQAVQYLVDEGADVSLKNEVGLNAADFARAQGHSDIAAALDARLQQATRP